MVVSGGAYTSVVIALVTSAAVVVDISGCSVVVVVVVVTKPEQVSVRGSHSQSCFSSSGTGGHCSPFRIFHSHGFAICRKIIL